MGGVFVYIPTRAKLETFLKQYFRKHIVNLSGILHKHMQKEYLLVAKAYNDT